MDWMSGCGENQNRDTEIHLCKVGRQIKLLLEFSGLETGFILATCACYTNASSILNLSRGQTRTNTENTCVGV